MIVEESHIPVTDWRHTGMGFFHPTIFILTHFLIVYVTIDSCILVFDLLNVFNIVLTQDYTCSVHEIFACSIFL